MIIEIRDQTYDEKQNTVTIKVICCFPEKIKKKIICKAGESVKSIEIKVPEDPKLKQKPKGPSPNYNNEDEKAKTTQPGKKPSSGSDDPPTKNPVPEPEQSEQDINTTAGNQPPTCCTECFDGHVGGPCFHGYGGDSYYQPRTCCTECYGGRAGGPCFHGYGGTSWPCHQPGYGYKPVCDESCFVHCHQQNSGTCTIM